MGTTEQYLVLRRVCRHAQRAFRSGALKVPCPLNRAIGGMRGHLHQRFGGPGLAENVKHLHPSGSVLSPNHWTVRP